MLMHGQGLGFLPSFWNHASRRNVAFCFVLLMLEERSKNRAGNAGLAGLRLGSPPHLSLQGPELQPQATNPYLGPPQLRF